ncbi:MAG TPA: DUF885 domain-containing protein, partial [Xanthomonadales bacterium]|nr:DUF885 domain-containing protein [Xanthomonadales bacterium]
DTITPSLVRYRDFLRDTYRPRARATIALSALPDGLACYTALLRAHSTLERTPREVYETGERTVAANEERVRALGRELFGTDDLGTILARVESAPDNRFASADEVLAHARESMARARERTATVFETMPPQDAVVEPLEEHLRGSGMASHYEANPDDAQPGVYRINLDHPEAERRGRAEITLVHEAWPGHHLQIAIARGLPGMHPFSALAGNSAYVEGWARYAEALAEEAGIYRSKYALVTRRIWPARAMVVDPGIHAFGWSRERAVAYLLATGRFTDATANELVDRIAAMPGQATAYDAGALALFALREQAERELGPRFDLKRFHTQLLSDGVVPLALLRSRVEAWIADEPER